MTEYTILWGRGHMGRLFDEYIEAHNDEVLYCAVTYSLVD